MASEVFEGLTGHATGALAEKCARPLPKPAQALIYASTAVAANQIMQLIFPALAGSLKLDMNGLTLARIMWSLQEVHSKLNTLLVSPLKEAGDLWETAQIHLRTGECEKAMIWFRKVISKAGKGFHSAQTVEDTIECMMLWNMASVYDSTYDIDSRSFRSYFDGLKDKTKRELCRLIKDRNVDLLAKVNALSNRWRVNRDKEGQEQLLNAHLQLVFPYILDAFLFEAASESLEAVLPQLVPFLPLGRGSWATHPSRGVLTIFKEKDEATDHLIVQADLCSGRCDFCGWEVRGKFHLHPVLEEHFAMHWLPGKLNCGSEKSFSLNPPSPSEANRFCKKTNSVGNCDGKISGVRTVRFVMKEIAAVTAKFVTVSSEVFHPTCAHSAAEAITVGWKWARQELCDDN